MWASIIQKKISSHLEDAVRALKASKEKPDPDSYRRTIGTRNIEEGLLMNRMKWPMCLWKLLIPGNWVPRRWSRIRVELSHQVQMAWFPINRGGPLDQETVGNLKWLEIHNIIKKKYFIIKDPELTIANHTYTENLITKEELIRIFTNGQP